MDDLELQTRLIEWDFHNGPANGVIDAASNHAIDAFLNNGRVNVPKSWTRARRLLAAKQLVCRRLDIEVGAIDGLYGPQTEYAFAVYQHRYQGGPDTDISEREEPPPPAPHAARQWPREAEVEAFFGAKGVNQVMLELPFTMWLSWEPSRAIRRFSVHKKAHDSALRAFQRIAQTYDQTARRHTGIDQFGGCLNVRRKRGGSQWSMHSWGIAIDFDPVRNPLHGDRRIARLAQPDCEAFWRIWEDEGWVSLGRTRDFDWMHVQAARL